MYSINAVEGRTDKMADLVQNYKYSTEKLFQRIVIEEKNNQEFLFAKCLY